eukprot:2186673-Rhodomonas_salina.3
MRTVWVSDGHCIATAQLTIGSSTFSSGMRRPVMQRGVCRNEVFGVNPEIKGKVPSSASVIQPRGDRPGSSIAYVSTGHHIANA